MRACWFAVLAFMLLVSGCKKPVGPVSIVADGRHYVTCAGYKVERDGGAYAVVFADATDQGREVRLFGVRDLRITQLPEMTGHWVLRGGHWVTEMERNPVCRLDEPDLDEDDGYRKAVARGLYCPEICPAQWAQ